MSKVDIFRNAANDFNGGEFTKEQLKEKCLTQGMEDRYFEKCFFDAVRVEKASFKLEEIRNGVYRRVALSSFGSRASRSATSASPVPHAPAFVRDSGVCAINEEAFKLLVYIIREWKDYFARIHSVGDPAHGGIYAYLKPTDAILLSSAGLTPTQYCFKQLAMHAQNSPAGNSIQFLSGGEPIVRNITGDYGLNQRAPLYGCTTDTALLSYLKTYLRKPNLKKKSHWFKYAKALIDINNYLYGGVAPKAHADIVRDFTFAHAFSNKSAECRAVVAKFVTEMPHGFSIALTLDTLKEFDPVFDYPKPDTHVKRIMYYMFQSHPVLVKNPERQMDEYLVIDLLEEILNKAKSAYISLGGTHAGDFTYYLLDKIIYLLCCKKPLYLPGEPAVSQSLTATHRKSFIDSIIRKDYLAIGLITPAEIADAIADIDSCL